MIQITIRHVLPAISWKVRYDNQFYAMQRSIPSPYVLCMPNCQLSYVGARHVCALIVLCCGFPSSSCLTRRLFRMSNYNMYVCAVLQAYNKATIRSAVTSDFLGSNVQMLTKPYILYHILYYIRGYGHLSSFAPYIPT